MKNSRGPKGLGGATVAVVVGFLALAGVIATGCTSGISAETEGSEVANPSGAESLRIGPKGVFSIRYVVSDSGAEPVLYRFDYNNSTDWAIAIIHEAEPTDQAATEPTDSFTTYGQPEGTEMIVISASDNGSTAPGPYFLTRTIPSESNVESERERSEVAAVAESLAIRTDDLIYFESNGESTIYSISLGIPLSIVYSDSRGNTHQTFRVVAIGN